MTTNILLGHILLSSFYNEKEKHCRENQNTF